MKARGLSLSLLLAAACLCGGCVERRFVITSDPPGAIVYDEKGIPIGATPVDKPFTYYGKYRFTLVKDGYQTMAVEENVRPPWYQFFLFDFVSENLIPYHFRDIHRLGGETGYPMQPMPIIAPEPVLQQAEQLRSRGLTIGAPPMMPTVPLGPPAP